jgi:pilus assembly protein CpaC
MIVKHASGAPRPKSPLRAAALLMAAMTAAPQAQVLQSTVARNSESNAASRVESDVNEVQLLVGRSAVLNIGQPITRVSLTSPNVADAMVTASQQLLVHGKAPGTISMFVWDRAGGIKRYEVIVQRDLSQLVEQIKQLFPGEPISVTSNGKDVVIAGTVSSKYVVDKAADVAAGYVEKKEDVVNLLKQQEGVATQQVLLRVRFAEVSRSAMSELGVSLFSDGRDGRFARTTTQQFAAPFFSEPDAILGRSLVFSDYLNLFLFDAKNQLGGVIRALQNKGLFQSLAEPNLIAENGKEASFLAGGEYPYPVIQGQAGGTSVTIQFKEFGIKLNFTPTIVGQDLVKLKVRPEVSSLDFSNALVIEGFRIPALQTRRTETEIELQDGQTFAIAGLMSNTVASQMRKVPGIGDIPILGLLFRSKAAEKNQTELVVMITPQILRRNSTGVSPTLPSMIEPFLPAPTKTVPTPAPWNPGAAVATPSPSMASAPQSNPAKAGSEESAVEGRVAGASAEHAASDEAVHPRVSSAAVASAPAPIESQPTAFHESAEPVQPATGPESRPSMTPVQAGAAGHGTSVDTRPAKLTKEQKAALERAKKEEKKQREAAAKQAERDRRAAAEQAKLEKKRAEQDRREAAEAAKEQARLDAEIQKRQAEAAKKQAESDKKRAEDLARAQQKLKAAQKEFDAVLGDRKP